MSKTKLIVAASIIIIIILSIGFFIGFASYIPISRFRSRALLVQKQKTEKTRLNGFLNKAAPGIVSETLGGQDWHLANQRGKVVLVFYWSIFCSNCIEEIPVMNELYSKYGTREDFLLIGVHRFGERDVIASYLSAKGILWPQLYEKGDSLPNGFINTMRITRTPTICIIDREGTVRAVSSDMSKVEEEVQGLMEKN